ncbi:MAG TPA: hypothetical protein VGH28_06320 [Polyangiaceae bacterium]|jgi:hypothetical protein
MTIQFERTHSTLTIDPSLPTPSGATAAPAETPDLLPGVSQLACSGDPGAMLAALTMQTAHSEEKVSRMQRDACERAEENDEAAEIKDLREKADLTRLQGIVGGALQLTQAAMQFGSSMKSLSADNLKQDAADASADAKGERADAQNFAKGLNDGQAGAMEDYAKQCDGQAAALTHQANGVQATASWYSGGASLAGATKTLADGLFGGAITDKDTDAKQHDIAAQSFKQMADDAHDDEKDAKDLLSKALDFYKEYVDTKNQTTMAAIHRA